MYHRDFTQKYLIGIFAAFQIVQSASFAGESNIIADSGKSHVQLVELFSSESCSSCPPADKWISNLKDKAKLWKNFVPVVFHVDYWNYLDWKDGFSSHAMTQRQVDLAHHWVSGGGVYTPSFIVDGKEWRNWRDSKDFEIPTNSKNQEGLQLIVSRKTKNVFSVSIQGKSADKKYVVRLAQLGFNIQTDVKSGENSGKILKHNFVVLNWSSKNLELQKKELEFYLEEPTQKTTRVAIAAWIEEDGNPTPLQATGAFL